MKRIITAALLCISLFTPAAARNLDEVAREIAAGSPALQAARARYEALVAADKAANSLPGPEIEGEYKWNATEEGNRWGAGISQAFDWPGAYAARSKAGALRSQAYDDLCRAEYADRLLEARTTLIDIAAAAEKLAILRKAADNNSRLTEIYRVAFESQRVSLLDVRKLDLQAFATDSRIAGAETELDDARSALSALTTEPTDGISIDALPAAEAPRALDACMESARTANPSLAAALRLSDAARASVSAARRAALPSFSLGYVHDFEENMHFNGLRVAIALPTWSPRRAITAAQAEATGAEFDQLDLSLRTTARLRAAHTTASQLYDRVSRAAETFDTGTYPELLNKALDMGAINIFTYYEEYNAWLDACLEYVDLRATLAKANAELDRLAPVQ
ncbi:MAG: TolC family protein [Bacteroidales bacterium]|nr:TolC family protein [Bacteroidales bacterium]